LEENQHTFCLLKRLAHEGDVSLVSINLLACSKDTYNVIPIYSLSLFHRFVQRDEIFTGCNYICLSSSSSTFCLFDHVINFQQVFLPYPYTRSVKVQWRVFEKLFTDFRDCFNHVDYYDMLACAKSRFQPIPSAWLGY